MFRNYLKIAVRSLLKHKLYSGINVFGLALGMACSLLIGLWVLDELSYDRFLPNVDRIHYVRVNFPVNGDTVTNFVTPGPLQEVIARDIPEVAAVTKINYGPELLIKPAGYEKSGKETGHFATADFFGVFDLPALAGNPKAALAQTNQIIITRKLADKYLLNGTGNYQQALGKMLQLDNDKFYVVGAVIDNIPQNSSFKFDWLVNWKVQEQDWMKTWGNNAFYTFVRLKPNTTLAQAEAAMSTIYPRVAGKNFESGRPTLQPLTDLHLYRDYKHGKAVGGRIEYVRIFSIVALFILLIACINFMNLATARSSIRAKEVGVRKVVGALRSSLVGQFLSESILTTLLAVVLAIGLVWLALPAFNKTFDKHLVLDLTEATFLMYLTGLILVTGGIAGSYPALFLSGLQPVSILKGRLQVGAGPALFRRTLVVFQFALSMFLIVGMLIVGQQMNYLRTKNLGLDRENILYMPLEGDIAQPKKVEAFRQEVLRKPYVVSASTSMMLPVNIQSTSGDLKWPGKSPDLQAQVSMMFVGGDFTRTMNIKLLDGRDFQTNNRADSAHYLVNEAAAKLMGMEKPGDASPVGKEVEFWPGKGQIIGLMKDFHIGSLHEVIKPLILCFGVDNRNTSYLLIKTRAGQTQQAIADLERLSKQFNPNYPFDYHFVDEEYEKLYNSEQQVHTLVNYFGILAILISCLGLFGLAAFTAEQRTKEIGVRKVLGASVGSIINLLSQDFLKLVFVAIVLASPLAWWSVDTWLNSFAYHTDVGWRAFALSGFLAVGIALLTVSFQSMKAALMNPVKSLKTE